MKKVFVFIFFILILGGGFYLYKNKKNNPNTPILSAIFPEGGFINPKKDDLKDIEGDVSSEENPQISGENITSNSKFKQLTTNPVAGYTSFNIEIKKNIPADPNIPKSKPSSEIIKKHLLRYVSRASGYIYEISDGEIPLQISNIYIPNIYEAYFIDNNKTAILRHLRSDKKTIASYSLPIPEENTDGTRTQKDGLYLPENIKSMAISPDTKSLVRLINYPNLTTVNTTSSTNTKNVEIFNSQLKEWLPFWSNQKIYLQTKASYVSPGYLYQVGINKSLKRILGDIKGLTVSISPSGNYIIYSESVSNNIVLNILNTKDGSVQKTSLNVLPEKCTWLKNDDLICAGGGVPAGNYPDDWYMGTKSFSDNLYKIYTSTNIFDVIYDQSNSFDMTNLSLNENSSILYFIDKNTGYLWSMKY